jgi:RNA polymerase-binding transcription factor DksA
LNSETSVRRQTLLQSKLASASDFDLNDKLNEAGNLQVEDRLQDTETLKKISYDLYNECEDTSEIIENLRNGDFDVQG